MVFGKQFYLDLLVTGLHHFRRPGLADFLVTTYSFGYLWIVLRLGLERQEPKKGIGNHRNVPVVCLLEENLPRLHDKVMIVDDFKGSFFV